MKRNWINSARFDLLWFIAPMLLPPLLVFLIPGDFLNAQRTEIFPWSWILIVLTIDVAHVYSTVYKTYFNSEGYKQHRMKLIYFPLLVWVGGAIIYSLGSKLFWSCVAYFAVYHFIRQQYGFFRLYSIHRQEDKLLRFGLNTCLYAFMVLPILIWHVRGQQNFNWMTTGDFLYINYPQLSPVLQIFLLLVAFIYIGFEYQSKRINANWNFARILLAFSTAFSYYTCIVLINNDFVFSFVNIIGHGIPYFALVWWSEKRQLHANSDPILKVILAKWGWLLFFLIVFLMAFFEEALWDSLLYRERPIPFGWLYETVPALDHPILIGIVVPLLIMPQIVHYILDAYIWKKRDNEKFVR